MGECMSACECLNGVLATMKESYSVGVIIMITINDRVL